MRRILWMTAAVIAAWLLHDRLDLEGLASMEGVRVLLADHGDAAPLVFFGVCVAAMLLHLPELLVLAAGGAFFGTLEAVLLGWSATVVGAGITFLASRYFLRDTVQRHLGGRSARFRHLDELIAAKGFRAVLLLRFAIPFAAPLNWLLGPTRVRFGDYMAGTALGIIPGSIIAVSFGERLTHVHAAADLLRPENLLPVLLLLALPLAGALLARRMLAGRKPI
jgi:uncharacterized membrane protein YdjX (TVP38/TMEM64 family)